MKIKDFKVIFEILRKRVKLSTLVLLIVLLSFNSFAWFIYATKVSGSISAHISSWNIEFKSGNGETETNINFDVEKIYPGMDTYKKEITVNNSGEFKATIYYEIKKIEILGQVYQVDNDTTSEELLNMISEEFPFKILINIENELEIEENSTASFEISVVWPFESGNDELDTMWGEKAYEYYSVNPNSNSLHIEMKIMAIQS